MKRLSWYVVPVGSLGNFRTDWRVVIAEDEFYARQQVEMDIDHIHHLFVKDTLLTRWIGPAHQEDIEALGAEKPKPKDVHDER